MALACTVSLSFFFNWLSVFAKEHYLIKVDFLFPSLPRVKKTGVGRPFKGESDAVLPQKV